MDIQPLISKKHDQNINRFGDDGSNCILCGKPTDQSIHVHMTTSLELVEANVDEDEISNSQGLFPIGKACAKKVDKKYLIKDFHPIIEVGGLILYNQVRGDMTFKCIGKVLHIYAGFVYATDNVEFIDDFNKGVVEFDYYDKLKADEFTLFDAKKEFYAVVESGSDCDGVEGNRRYFFLDKTNADKWAEMIAGDSDGTMYTTIPVSISNHKEILPKHKVLSFDDQYV